VSGVGQIARFVAAGQSSWWGDNGDFEIALLTEQPTLTSGEWDADLSSIELTSGTAPGYERATLAAADIAAATGNNPVVRSNAVAIDIAPNRSASAWPAVAAVAIIAVGLADALTAVIPLSRPLIVGANTAASIDVGQLRFVAASA
jgi:hypothetical protein